MTAVNEKYIANLIANEISPHFPSRTPVQPNTERTISIHLDSKKRAAFDPDGIYNDFVGTAHFIVTEKTEKTGWCGSTQINYFTKRFSYFLKDGKTLILRELDPTQSLNFSGFEKVPSRCVPASSKSGGVRCSPLTPEEVQGWVAARIKNDPIEIFIGNIDSRPGDEIEFLRRGQALGIVNFFTDLYKQ
jgi:hypothetical protein